MQTDRWIEMDVFFFQEKPFNKPAREVVERLAPLFRDVKGDYGIVLCCAWLCDIVTEWQGQDDQTLPFRSPTARNWSDRTYADLRELLEALKTEAAAIGLPDFKIALTMVAWGTFSWGEGGGYDLKSGWFERHPEIYFEDHWRNIDYRKRLKADSHSYASLPSGIPEGLSFAEFFAGQWKHLSGYLEFDAIHFRDGFLGRAVYEMVGPFGHSLPKDPAAVEEWQHELINFFRRAKQANPGCILMVYSSARSAVGEYRTGCFDLAALVASEAIDVWVDQTWAGAWQDWWTHEFRGWTFQLANLIAHQIMIAAGNAKRKIPCRHHHLIETWDAWEPWDTLHQVPRKLRWGMWAFSHAAVRTPSGLSRTTGTYISWAHNWENRLIDEQDVDFLGANLNAAIVNAEGMEEVYGPAMALNLPQMEAIQKSTPGVNTGDLIDDQCAMLMKWGLPCLSGVSLGEAPVPSEGYVLQTPAALSPEWTEYLAQKSSAYIAAGAAQYVDQSLLDEVGAKTSSTDFKVGKQRLVPPVIASDVLPRVSSVCLPPNRQLEQGTSEIVARTVKNILMAKSPEAAKFLWLPPHPFVPWISYLGQSQYGSLAPFIALNRSWQRATRGSHAAHIEDLPAHLPVAFHFWRSHGSVFILAGNLETGICGDSRNPRDLTFTLNKQILRLTSSAHALRNLDDDSLVRASTENEASATYSIHLVAQDSTVFEVVAG